MAKPNYRHQKKQKELVRKTRHAEKLKRRIGREDTAAAPVEPGAGIGASTGIGTNASISVNPGTSVNPSAVGTKP